MLSGKAAVGPVNLYANYEKAKNDNYAGAAGSAEKQNHQLERRRSAGPGKLLAFHLRHDQVVHRTGHRPQRHQAGLPSRWDTTTSSKRT